MDKKSLTYKKMRGAYIQAINEHSTNIYGLYNDLNKIFDEALKKGEVNDGEEFICDLGSHVSLRFVFHKEGTELYSTNLSSSTQGEKCIVSRDMTLRHAEKEEKQTLIGYETALENLGLQIAKTNQRSFAVALNKLKPGVIVSFTEGKMYVCRENKDLLVTLDQVFDGDLKNINPASFTKKPSIQLDISNTVSVQAFYNQNAKNFTWTCEAEYAILSDCILELERLKKNISRSQSKTFQLGPVSIIGKKSVFSDQVKWYDTTGTQITEEQLSYLIGLLHTQPTNTKYIRKESTYEKTAADEEFRLQIEHLLDRKEYEKAYHEMIKYSEIYTEDLIIQTDGFLRNSQNEYIAGSIVFRNGKAYQLTYENNDLSKDIKETKPLSEVNFVALCQCKYTDTYERHFAKTVELVEKEYHLKLDSMTESQKHILKDVVEKEIAKESGIILSKKEIEQGAIEFHDILDELDDSETINNFLRR